MESLVVNISGGVRREKVNGRDFLVAPLTMMVSDTILHGSRGPLFYPASEVSNSTPYWEGVILTNGHLPDGLNGRRIKVQEEYGMGFVQNPVIKNKQLKAEGWFDVEKTSRLNPNIVQSLLRGEKMELSTGLNGEFDPTPGVHNGNQYTHILRRYRPDHLAILTQERGACALTHGCGVNNADEQTIARVKKNKKKLTKQSGTKSGCPEMHDARLIQRTDNKWSPQAREAALEARKYGRRTHTYAAAAKHAGKATTKANTRSHSLTPVQQAVAHYKAAKAHAHAFDNATDAKQKEYHRQQFKEHLSQFKSAKAVASKRVHNTSHILSKLTTMETWLEGSVANGGPGSGPRPGYKRKATSAKEHSSYADTLSDRTANVKDSGNTSEQLLNLHQTSFNAHLAAMQKHVDASDAAPSESSQRQHMEKANYHQDKAEYHRGGAASMQFKAKKKDVNNMLNDEELEDDLDVEQEDVDNAWSDAARAAAKLKRYKGFGHAITMAGYIEVQMKGKKRSVPNEGLAYTIHETMQGINEGKHPNDAFHDAAENQNLYGDRPDIRKERETAAAAMKKHLGITINPHHEPGHKTLHKRTDNFSDEYPDNYGPGELDEMDDEFIEEEVDVDNAWSQQARDAAALKRKQLHKFLEQQDAGPGIHKNEVHFITGLGEHGKYVFHPQGHIDEYISEDKVATHKNLNSIKRAWKEGSVDNAWSDAARNASAEARRQSKVARDAMDHEHLNVVGARGVLRESSEADKHARMAMTAPNSATAAMHHQRVANLHERIADAIDDNFGGPGARQAAHAHGRASEYHIEAHLTHNEGEPQVFNAWSDAARQAAALKRKNKAKAAKSLSTRAHNYSKKVSTHDQSDAAGLMKAHIAAERLHQKAASNYKKGSRERIEHEERAKSHGTSAYLSFRRVNNVVGLKNNSGDLNHFHITRKKILNEMENTMSKLNETQREELITGIVTNCDCYSEEDRDELELLDDRMLTSINNGAKLVNVEKELETVKNAAPKTIDVKNLPAEMQSVLNYGQRAIDRDKSVLVDRLVANIAKDQQEAERKTLMVKGIDDLEQMVKYLPAEKVENTNGYHADFSGAGAGRFVNNAKKLEPAGGSLGHPVIDWSQN